MMFRGLILEACSLISRRQLHVISRSKTNIKPDSPTPQLNLNRYKLPYHDRMLPNFYVPIIFFYPSSPKPLANETTIPNLLKNSLSKALSKYYHFAGRLGSSGSYVECNDEGAHFFEARIACTLSEVLKRAPAKDEKEGFGHLFPPRSIWYNLLDTDCLMVVQLNHFSCGGIAVAVSITHRLVDGVTLLSFLNYWASLSRDPNVDQEKLVQFHPQFMYELLPQSYDDNILATQASYPQKHWITTEVVFHNSKIAELKANQKKQDIIDGVVADQNYTRNELVTALLYKCAVAAAATSNSGVYPKSVLFQAVDMRSLFHQPLPKTSVGNLFTFNHIPTSTMSETKLNPIVSRLRKGKMQLQGIKSLDGKGAVPLVEKYANTDHKLYLVSSICNAPLYDEMDFGWGKPVRASIVDAPFVNSFILMDTTSRDGIKATVNLEEEDMKNFRADKELLAYASI